MRQILRKHPLKQFLIKNMSAAIPNRSGSIAAESGITAGTRREFAYRKYLFLLFLISFPLINPIVHGDGVGYYAYARAPLIRHNLRFEEDWQRANTYFSSSRVQDDQQLNVDQYTSTGYVGNHFTVGPAMLWVPFLIVAHLIVLLCNALGAHIGADGFSSPYLVAMALGTAKKIHRRQYARREHCRVKR